MKKSILFVSALMAGLVAADQQAAAADPDDYADCHYINGITTCEGTFGGFREHASATTFARFYTQVSASGVPSYFFQANFGGLNYACEANANLAARWHEFMAANGEFEVVWRDIDGGECYRINIWKSSDQARLN
ncbi:hypothetical protein WMF38_36655 [Sorangium sp. So ce118]